MRRLLAAMTLLAVAATAAPADAARKKTKRVKPSPLVDVMVVSNNWDGTADIVDARTFKRLKRLNIIPDKAERLAEIYAAPDHLVYFMAIRQLVGEGNDQFVDDAFTSPDGRMLYVSRPSFADVIGMRMKTGEIVWRTKLEGYRSDHMAISHDGSRVLVSDSTAAKVHEIDTATGKIVGHFPSGDQPHENNYSRDGTKVFHASIGQVFSPFDRPTFFDTTKGKRFFQIVDARTNTVLKRYDMGQKLREAGYSEMSSAVRPMALSPDEKWVYFQVSFHHGFVEFDLTSEKVTRVAYLPISEETKRIPREEYLLDSAHHGLAMDPTGRRLCAAGTMSDYAAIVNRRTFAWQIAARGIKPYWSTNSRDGRHCWVSFSGNDDVSVISYRTQKEIARIPVGDHPQRIREGYIRRSFTTR